MGESESRAGWLRFSAEPVVQIPMSNQSQNPQSPETHALLTRLVRLLDAQLESLATAQRQTDEITENVLAQESQGTCEAIKAREPTLQAMAERSSEVRAVFDALLARAEPAAPRCVLQVPAGMPHSRLLGALPLSHREMVVSKLAELDAGIAAIAQRDAADTQLLRQNRDDVARAMTDVSVARGAAGAYGLPETGPIGVTYQDRHA